MYVRTNVTQPAHSLCRNEFFGDAEKQSSVNFKERSDQIMQSSNSSKFQKHSRSISICVDVFKTTFSVAPGTRAVFFKLSLNISISSAKLFPLYFWCTLSKLIVRSRDTISFVIVARSMRLFLLWFGRSNK